MSHKLGGFLIYKIRRLRMIKTLKIHFDGCDTVEIDWDNVISLGMTDVNKAYQYMKNTTLEMTVANNVCLTLSKNADIPYQKFSVGEFTTTFKRLYDCRDITSLSLIHDDGKEEEFYVAYDEDEFRCFNKLQSTGIDDEGNLIIKIGRF